MATETDEDAARDEGAESETPARRRPPLLVLIAAAVVLLAVIAAIAFLLLGKKQPEPEAGAEPEHSSFEYGPHKDSNDENAQRAAALARQAAEDDLPSNANANAPAPPSQPAAATPAAAEKH